MRNRLISFRYAFAGLAFVVKTQPNARIHLAASLMVIPVGFFLGLERDEWLWIGLAIAMVWILEILNSAIEYLCDVVSPEHSQSVKHAKDIAAAAVLLGAVFAVFVGALILLPKLAVLF